jgi:hypothetical protein
MQIGEPSQPKSSDSLLNKQLRAYRVEIPSIYFHRDSALLLLDEGTHVSRACEAVEFLNDALWADLERAHPDFTQALRQHVFDPSCEVDSRDWAPTLVAPGLSALVDALRFAERRKDVKLVIAGHSAGTEDDEGNRRLSAARAACVLSILTENRDGFVDALSSCHQAPDMGRTLSYCACARGWACAPQSSTKASTADIERFQRAYNEFFPRQIAISGLLDPATWGALFDYYQQELAHAVGGLQRLARLRAKLHFLADDHRYVACGDRYPRGGSIRGQTGSQEDGRVELLFFASATQPTLAEDSSGGEIYGAEITFLPCDLGRRRTVVDGSKSAKFSLLDAPSPEPGVGEPAEPLCTQMPSTPVLDPSDPWAFLEPLDRARATGASSSH